MSVERSEISPISVRMRADEQVHAKPSRKPVIGAGNANGAPVVQLPPLGEETTLSLVGRVVVGEIDQDVKFTAEGLAEIDRALQGAPLDSTRLFAAVTNEIATEPCRIVSDSSGSVRFCPTVFSDSDIEQRGEALIARYSDNPIKAYLIKLCVDVYRQNTALNGFANELRALMNSHVTSFDDLNTYMIQHPELPVAFENVRYWIGVHKDEIGNLKTEAPYGGQAHKVFERLKIVKGLADSLAMEAIKRSVTGELNIELDKKVHRLILAYTYLLAGCYDSRYREEGMLTFSGHQNFKMWGALQPGQFVFSSELESEIRKIQPSFNLLTNDSMNASAIGGVPFDASRYWAPDVGDRINQVKPEHQKILNDKDGYISKTNELLKEYYSMLSI